jgi:hypothetical protein
MLYDDPKLETPLQKAERTWHNGQIIRKIMNKIDEEFPQPIDNVSFERALNTFKKEFRALLINKSTNMLAQYLIVITNRKRRLLKEKLKRLEKNKCQE